MSSPFNPLGLYKRKKKYNYFLLNIVSDNSNFVDYKKSTFLEYDMVTGKYFDAISVSSKEDLLKKGKVLEERTDDVLTIWGDNIVMNKRFDNELDLFIINIIDGSTYISERLKNDIESHGLTGLEFTPANKLVISK